VREQLCGCSAVGQSQPTAHCHYLEVNYNGSILEEQHRSKLVGLLNLPEKNKNTSLAADG